MEAVIATGGKQYRVAPGQVISIEKLPGETGSSIEFRSVLLVTRDGAVIAVRRTVPDRRIHPCAPAGDAVQAGSQRGARLRRHPVREGGRLRPVRAARRLTLREHRPRARVTAGGPPPGPRGWVCSSTRSIF